MSVKLTMQFKVSQSKKGNLKKNSLSKPVSGLKTQWITVKCEPCQFRKIPLNNNNNNNNNNDNDNGNNNDKKR